MYSSTDIQTDVKKYRYTDRCTEVQIYRQMYLKTDMKTNMDFYTDTILPLLHCLSCLLLKSHLGNIHILKECFYNAISEGGQSKVTSLFCQHNHYRGLRNNARQKNKLTF